LALENEIDARERHAPVLGLDHQDIANAFPSHLLVGVAEDDGVDARYLGGDGGHLVLVGVASPMWAATTVTSGCWAVRTAASADSTARTGFRKR